MRRRRPAWQAGRLNALGGKLMQGEGAATAARREVLVWDDAEYVMHVMRGESERASEARTMEDQEVFLADVNALPHNVIDNLRWLVPLALDGDVAFPIMVRSAAPAGSGLTERGRTRE